MFYLQKNQQHLSVERFEALPKSHFDQFSHLTKVKPNRQLFIISTARMKLIKQYIKCSDKYYKFHIHKWDIIWINNFMFLFDYVSFLLLFSDLFTDESTGAIGREFWGTSKSQFDQFSHLTKVNPNWLLFIISTAWMKLPKQYSKWSDESTTADERKFQGSTKESPWAILTSDQGKAKLTVIYHIYCSN